MLIYSTYILLAFLKIMEGMLEKGKMTLKLKVFNHY